MQARLFTICSFLAAFLMAGAIPGLAQAPASSTPPALAVNGDVSTTLSLTPFDLKSMPRTRVQIKDEDGRAVTYEGAAILSHFSNRSPTLHCWRIHGWRIRGRQRPSL
jgi:hypothetical protein